jgi:hypothetical protein
LGIDFSISNFNKWVGSVTQSSNFSNHPFWRYSFFPLALHRFVIIKDKEMRLKTTPGHSLFAWICGLALLGMAHAGIAMSPAPRIALVVGISKHQDPRLGTLATARNDAEDIAKALASLGFQVTSQFDADLPGLHSVVSSFTERLNSDAYRNALALVYFAGYGLQKGGHNFLLPATFDASHEPQDLGKSAIEVEHDIINNMVGRNGGANIIILDACRENLFGQRQGLAQIAEVPNGTLVEFAAEPNNPSIESMDTKAPDRNGIFAKELLKKLDKPNPAIDLQRFFDILGNNVYEASNKAQRPRVITSSTPPAMPLLLTLAQDSAPTRALDEDLALWDRLNKSAAPCAYEQYLKRFPDGDFADSAKAAINAIRAMNEAAPLAFASLPKPLKAQASSTHRAKQEASEAECAGGASLGEAGAEPSRPDDVGDVEFQADLLRARQGEINAMYRTARVYEDGGHGVEPDRVEMLHWLALSSQLGNGLASYRLYRYFATEGNSRVSAAHFRGLAAKQGYYGPPEAGERPTRLQH